MTTYASTRQLTAWLGKEFGLDLATRWFGAEIVDSLPRYVRGPKKGQHKATLTWEKCESGGWSRGAGGVRFPGDIWDIALVLQGWGQSEATTLWTKADRDAAPIPHGAAAGSDVAARITAERAAAEEVRRAADVARFRTEVLVSILDDVDGTSTLEELVEASRQAIRLGATDEEMARVDSLLRAARERPAA